MREESSAIRRACDVVMRGGETAVDAAAICGVNVKTLRNALFRRGYARSEVHRAAALRSWADPEIRERRLTAMRAAIGRTADA